MKNDYDSLCYAQRYVDNIGLISDMVGDDTVQAFWVCCQTSKLLKQERFLHLFLTF